MNDPQKVMKDLFSRPFPCFGESDSFFRETPDEERWEDIVYYLTGEYISNQQIWDVARKCDYQPSFTNVYLMLVFRVIRHFTYELHPKTSIYHYSDCLGSYLTINGKNVWTLEDYLKAVKDD